MPRFILSFIVIAFSFIPPIFNCEAEGAAQTTKVSVDLKDIEVRQVLNYIGDILKVNIVVDSEVVGRVTIVVNDVPVSQLLESVLRMEGLYQVKQGRVIYVMPVGKVSQYLP